MTRPLRLIGFALLALAFGQVGGTAHAATASTSFAVSVRVASVCEASGLCGGAVIRILDASGHAAALIPAGALVTPLAATADRDAGERIDTRQNNGPVEIDF
jgi:hypothetical protein